MSILQSIKPVHCENIATGIKEYELRKGTRPKCELSVKCYIYCTKDKWQHLVQMPDKTYRLYNGKEYGKFDKSLQFSNEVNGKVIGEYVCDEIIEWTEDMSPPVPLDKIQLSYPEIRKYGGDKTLYLWHISDLKIYDKPKELSDFIVKGECLGINICLNCSYFHRATNYNSDNDCELVYTHKGYRPLTHPPQSWCYVEEV